MTRPAEQPHMALVNALFIGQLLPWASNSPKLHGNKPIAK
jgi:hypothetical protein